MKKTIITLTASLFAMLSPAQNLISSGSPLYKLPYKNTYVMQTLVAENTFRTAKVEKPKPGSFEQAKKVLPAPYWEGHEKEIEMYWKAWQIGIKNVCQPLDNSGFVTSYISPAYNGNIFMWDDAFITMFCRYGDRFFPFQKTLDNFYAKQHPDGFICREIRADGSDCFGRYDPTSTGPNLLPWSEWLYFTQFGDDNRLNKVFPVLAAYYKWLKLNRTWRNGTYWSSGWGTGMDNMPRVPEVVQESVAFAPHILVDVSREVLDVVLKLLYLLPALQIESHLQQDVSHHYLLQAGVQASLAADNPKYKANGRYWVGGVWPGTNYMVISGLVNKGYRRLAHDIVMNHYNNVLDVYKKTGTFWEYYAPESASPGFMARKDFVGWTGLPPIADLIEYIFGIRADIQDNHVTLDVQLTDAYGIDRYPLGEKGNISFKVAKRSSVNDKPKVTIHSNIPFKLTLVWGNGESVEKEVKEGNNVI